jgi:hypothetical protein
VDSEARYDRHLPRRPKDCAQLFCRRLSHPSTEPTQRVFLVTGLRSMENSWVPVASWLPHFQADDKPLPGRSDSGRPRSSTLGRALAVASARHQTPSTPGEELTVPRKRKTLPKDFEETLAQAPLEVIKKTFDTCELNARGGEFKCTALGFDSCSDDLARWLVAQGLDVDTADALGRTPLYQRASAGKDLTLLLELGADVNGSRRSPVMAAINHPEALRVLLQHGADIDAHTGDGTPLHRAALRSAESTRILLDHGANPAVLDRAGRTPVAAALRACRNIEIVHVAGSVRILLDAGCPIPDDAADMVTRIGEQFEFHRTGFNPRYLSETDAALSVLYILFGVPPVGHRTVHDGSSTISVDATEPTAQFDELWNLLVPSSGRAATVQGEVIRLAGRIARELLDNGGINWDRSFRRMKDALINHLGSATPVATPAERTELSKNITRDKYDEHTIQRVTDLAVAWVLANPSPTPLESVKYDY